MVRVRQFVAYIFVCSSLLISGISLAETKNNAAEQRHVPQSLIDDAIRDISDGCDNPDEYDAFLKLKETAKKDQVTAKELFGLSDDFMVPISSDYRKKIGINNLKECHVAFANIRASFVDFLEGFYPDEDGINFHRFSINLRKLAYRAASEHNMLNDVKKLFIPLNKIKMLKIYNQKPLPWRNPAQIITQSIFDVQRSHTISFHEPESIYFFFNIHTVMDAACDTYLNPNTVEYMLEPEWQIVVCEKAKREKEILSFILDIENKSPQELRSRLEEIETFRSSWDKGAVELRHRYKVLKSEPRDGFDFIKEIPSELERMHNILKVYIYTELGETEKLTELYPTVSFFFTPIGKLESKECADQPITTIAKVQATLLKNKLSYVSLKNSLCKYSPEKSI